MSECLSVDTLVTVAGAVDWDVAGLLDHVASCGNCRTQLYDLARLHGALATSVPARPGFADAVVRGLPAAGPSSVPLRWPAWVTPVLAGAASFFAIALASSRAPMSVGGSSVATSIAVMVAVGWWMRRGAPVPTP